MSTMEKCTAGTKGKGELMHFLGFLKAQVHIGSSEHCFLKGFLIYKSCLSFSYLDMELGPS